MQTPKELREKIEALETDRSSVTAEIESLRKAAESRAANLEGEVSQMCEVAKSLRELLGTNSKETVSAPNVQKIQILPDSS